jgi:''Cold-shock'' DNA-binding domain.
MLTLRQLNTKAAVENNDLGKGGFIMKGIVKFWDKVKKRGFIRANGENYFVTTLNQEDDSNCLQKGQVVEFEVETLPDGRVRGRFQLD